jgi:hypothetical protein
MIGGSVTFTAKDAKARKGNIFATESTDEKIFSPRKRRSSTKFIKVDWRSPLIVDFLQQSAFIRVFRG